MTNSKKQTIVVKLRRSGRDQPWGIRIVGGADLGTPIIVTRSENEELLKGDVIKKIDDYDARDVRHVDAQHLLQKSDAVKLVVERTKAQSQKTKFLPKSPVPQQEQDYESTTTTYTRYNTPESFALPHEHLDEVREERAHLYQVTLGSLEQDSLLHRETKLDHFKYQSASQLVKKRRIVNLIQKRFI